MNDKESKTNVINGVPILGISLVLFDLLLVISSFLHILFVSIRTKSFFPFFVFVFVFIQPVLSKPNKTRARMPATRHLSFKDMFDHSCHSFHVSLCLSIDPSLYWHHCVVIEGENNFEHTSEILIKNQLRASIRFCSFSFLFLFTKKSNQLKFWRTAFRSHFLDKYPLMIESTIFKATHVSTLTHSHSETFILFLRLLYHLIEPSHTSTNIVALKRNVFYSFFMVRLFYQRDWEKDKMEDEERLSILIDWNDTLFFRALSLSASLHIECCVCVKPIPFCWWKRKE